MYHLLATISIVWEYFCCTILVRRIKFLFLYFIIPDHVTIIQLLGPTVMCCKKRRTTCCGCTVCCILCCLLLYFLFQFNPWPFWARLCSPPHVSYSKRFILSLFLSLSLSLSIYLSLSISPSLLPPSLSPSLSLSLSYLSLSLSFYLSLLPPSLSLFLSPPPPPSLSLSISLFPLHQMAELYSTFTMCRHQRAKKTSKG